MPKHVKARAPQDEREERAVRKLARGHHALADWILHARMVVESWVGKTPDQIAAQLHCHPQTVPFTLPISTSKASMDWGSTVFRAQAAADRSRTKYHRRLAQQATSWSSGDSSRRDDSGVR